MRDTSTRRALKVQSIGARARVSCRVCTSARSIDRASEVFLITLMVQLNFFLLIFRLNFIISVLSGAALSAIHGAALS